MINAAMDSEFLDIVCSIFSRHACKLFSVTQLPAPDTYRTTGLSIEGNLHACLEK